MGRFVLRLDRHCSTPFAEQTPLGSSGVNLITKRRRGHGQRFRELFFANTAARLPPWFLFAWVAPCGDSGRSPHLGRRAGGLAAPRTPGPGAPTDMESVAFRFHLMGFFVIGACDPLPCVHVAGSHVVVIEPNTSRDGRASVCPQWNLIGGFRREPEVPTWTTKVLKTVQPTWWDG